MTSQLSTIKCRKSLYPALAPKYIGSFIIKQKLSDLIYKLVGAEGKDCGTWHVKDLKDGPPDLE